MPWSAAVSKMIALSVFTFVAMALDVIVQCIATPLFYMEQNSEMQQTYLRCLAASMWSHFICIFCHGNGNHYKNNVISMIIAVCMCTGIFTLIFSGINILIEKSEQRTLI